MKNLLLAMVLAFGVTSCDSSGSGTTAANDGEYIPTNHYVCDYVFDTLSGQYIYACFWVFYSEDGTLVEELDIAADIADIEAFKLEKSASYYSEKFSLSQAQALKIARNVRDLSSLTDRNLSDIEDFANKLYGINTNDIISAASEAQFGNNEQMDVLIKRAAESFKTTDENMRLIIKDIHQEALKASGIEL